MTVLRTGRSSGQPPSPEQGLAGAPSRQEGVPIRMWVTQKCQYALRALFELAKRQQDGIVRAADIAANQAIPKRFLEVILHQLRQGGFVDSQRGKEGGFFLSRPPESITVGEIIRFIDGPISPVDCQLASPHYSCTLKESCVFLGLWDEARLALEGVYDTKTLKDLVEREQGMFFADAPPILHLETTAACGGGSLRRPGPERQRCLRRPGPDARLAGMIPPDPLRRVQWGEAISYGVALYLLGEDLMRGLAPRSRPPFPGVRGAAPPRQGPGAAPLVGWVQGGATPPPWRAAGAHPRSNPRSLPG